MPNKYLDKNGKLIKTCETEIIRVDKQGKVKDSKVAPKKAEPKKPDVKKARSKKK